MTKAGQVRRGARIAFDYGSARIGVAVCDPEGIMASPLTTVDATSAAQFADISAIIDDYSPVELVVGNPRSLDGVERKAAKGAQEFCNNLAKHTDIPVILIDERLTTAGAHRAMSLAGKNSRQRRKTVDAAAAAIILQNYLDSLPPKDIG